MIRPRPRPILNLIWGILTLIYPVAIRASAADEVDFTTRIRPLLEARCYSCHGPEKQKSGLRLDHKKPAMQGGDSGKVILPGQGEESLLYRVIAGLDPDLRMPPKGEPLPAEEIELVKQWIDQGAEWPDDAEPVKVAASDHWAFQPIRRPEVPAVRDGDWVRNPIDAFILEKLEREGVEPSPPADRWTLIRRLSLDLTGLPPSPEEVLEFVNDPDPDAYEKLVDRLLASPHYGERMARHWLDLARYADSDGYEKDRPRPHAWRYREWVIRAFNRDLPYDRFTLQQIAGDLLPEGGTSAKVATGFHRNTLTNREGGIDPEEDRVKQNVDRLNTTGTVFLGLTIGCAQCHSHKYDPITQREYYQMYAFFDHAIEKDIPAVLSREQRAYEAARAQWETERDSIEKEIADYRPTLEERLMEWEKKQTVSEVEWQLLRPSSIGSIGGATFEIEADGAIRVGGLNPLVDRYRIVVPTQLKNIVAIRLEALTDPSLPRGGPGRASHGNFILSEIALRANRMDRPTSGNQVPFDRAIADYHEAGYEVEKAIDGNRETGWSIDAWRDPSLNVDRSAVFITKDNAGFEGGTLLEIRMDFEYGNRHNLGRFRLYAASGSRKHLDLPPAIPAILAIAPEERTEEQKVRLLDYFGTIDPDARKLYEKRAAHKKKKPAPPGTMAQTLAANPNPPVTHIHTRGDFLRPGDPVTPTTLAVLQPFHPRSDKPDRLDLARWIIDPDNPLTARVAVNRWWMYLFGRGIVNTPEDFGTRGEKPSHPELLDWLASEYMETGWRTKDFIRMVVLSNTYRQASRTRLDLIDRDPENVWLARQNRLRVEAEIIRDLSLSVSGLLNPKIGGPSIRPPLPEGVADLGYARQVRWRVSEGAEKYRRGLYIFFQRTVPYPMLITFDCPDSNVTAGKRSRSNTPLQALTLLNNSVFTECAQHFGERICREGGANDRARIRYAYLLAVAREPSPAEVRILENLLNDLRATYRTEPEQGSTLLAGLKVEDEDCAEMAAWVSAARILLNLDEFITRE